jgi:RNA polymerase sigma-70 factor (ECF subfamily)
VNDPSDAAYRRHREQVLRYLRRRTGSDELAEDLTQDVFLSAAEHLSHLDNDRPVLAWLYVVARNRLIDEARRVRPRPRVVSLDAAPEEWSELDYRPEVGQALRRASLRLSERDRELLGLRLFGERSFAAIAARLGISEPAAKMRYMRVLRTLRAELEREGIEP